MHREVLTDGVSFPGRLFGGKEQFKSMAMWKFLKGVIGLGTGMVAMAPGGAIAIVGAIQENETLLLVGVILILLIGLPAIVYVSLGLMLGEHAVALEDMGPMDALERSWSLARGNRFSLLLFKLRHRALQFARSSRLLHRGHRHQGDGRLRLDGGVPARHPGGLGELAVHPGRGPRQRHDGRGHHKARSDDQDPETQVLETQAPETQDSVDRRLDEIDLVVGVPKMVRQRAQVGRAEAISPAQHRLCQTAEGARRGWSPTR